MASATQAYRSNRTELLSLYYIPKAAIISAAGAKADRRPHTNHQLELFNNALDAFKSIFFSSPCVSRARPPGRQQTSLQVALCLSHVYSVLSACPKPDLSFTIWRGWMLKRNLCIGLVVGEHSMTAILSRPSPSLLGSVSKLTRLLAWATLKPLAALNLAHSSSCVITHLRPVRPIDLFSGVPFLDSCFG